MGLFSGGGSLGQLRKSFSGGADKALSAGLENLGASILDPYGAAESITDAGKAQLEENQILEEIREGPGGSVGHAVDQIYGGDTKKAVGSAQEFYRDAEGGLHYWIGGKRTPEEEGEEEGTAADTLETTPEEREALLQQGKVAKGGRQKKYGRTAMIEAKDKASILAP